ncbi:DUF917 domain-containing protein [Actinocrispum wychmicini]|nr:DUF917 domain-containing protein [Actinocrispum wychmicini]
MRIDTHDVAALERGVSLLGSGGGGYGGLGALLLRQRLAAGRDVVVLDLAELPAEARVVPVGVVGATAVFSEKLPSGAEFGAAVAAVERWTGTTADSVVSIEIGGMNGVIPLVVGCDLGLPVVDADLAGRGLPRLDQLSLAAAGRDVTPAALAEPSGQVLVLAQGSASDVERTARAFLTSAGGWAAFALPPIPVRDLPGCSMPNTVTHAIDLGRRALAHPTAFVTEVGGRVLAEGRVMEVSRRPGVGRHGQPTFGRGSVVVADHGTQALLRLEMENEYLLAIRDGAVTASTPDILTVVDRRTGVPISCDLIRAGTEVAVLHLPTAEFWTDPRHLPAVAPRAYDIDCDPVLL